MPYRGMHPLVQSRHSNRAMSPPHNRRAMLAARPALALPSTTARRAPHPTYWKALLASALPANTALTAPAIAALRVPHALVPRMAAPAAILARSSMETRPPAVSSSWLTVLLASLNVGACSAAACQDHSSTHPTHPPSNTIAHAGTSCLPGTFADVASAVCGECASSCATCSGPSSAECTSCSSGTFLDDATCGEDTASALWGVLIFGRHLLTHTCKLGLLCCLD
jgi:hypothetical protein